ncbi:D-alanine--(R)-lactate ligase [Microbacterium sp. X-17]|uniref:D-alanine--(R)-lactate ligase n=1 Tax=Microbacterium sp. X-17 TaxID=3144404 RepID=UPI0031F5895C
MSRPRVAILFGGDSEEHPISVKSAREVARSIDTAAYELIYVGITRGGAWRLCASPDDDLDAAGGRSVALSPDRGMHGLLVDGEHSPIRLDAALPVLHGRHGEDGAIQGLLELAGIPYAGCDLPSSALCMDKSLAYVVARSAGIRTPEFRIVTPDADVDASALAYPVFVKPARSGSSFGVSRVDRAEDLAAAVADAAAYDAKVLVEGAVAGSEVGCAILETERGLVVGEVDQVRLSHGFFRIHQEDAPEQGSENATIVVPADVPAETRRRVQEAAKRIYRALGCRGLARVDMFLTADGEVVLNEVNTMPGMTSYSRYPRMMAAAGLSLTAVIDGMLSFALRGGRS